MNPAHENTSNLFVKTKFPSALADPQFYTRPTLFAVPAMGLVAHKKTLIECGAGTLAREYAAYL